MFIDRYKQEDGWYLDEQGVSYESPEEFLATKLGFCMCGIPEAAFDHVRKSLRLISDFRNKNWEYEHFEAENKKLFGDLGPKYFMWYFLDNKGLTEHGGMVPGWLTDEGNEMLSDLDELFSEEKN